ncbi:MAG: JAB domain-containing protein [Chryseobacterium sp.]|nr:MAG: JAB domain-containing protein [Chryseobacterium sp.]
MSLKYLAEDDRPREKFLLKGRNALSDSELLAIIMGSGSRNESAVELGRRILASVDNSWHNLSRLSIQDLKQFKGVGEAKAISIAAAMEIGRRRASQEVPERPQIRGSRDAYNILHPHLADQPTEEFWCLFLNQNNRVVHKAQLTQGGITQSVVDIRILFRTALQHFATAIIVAHNHPSGNLQASSEDINITKKIKEAGQLLQIDLLDHLIISNQGYLSFTDENIL